MKISLHKGLAFRIVAPIIGVTVIMGIALYLSLLKTVSDFAHKQIESVLEKMGHDIYEIYDSALNELSSKGLINDKKMVTIQKAKVLAMIEDFMRGNNLKGVIIEDMGRPIERLNVGNLPERLEELSSKLKEKKVTSISLRGRKYYVYSTYLDLWRWHLLVFKDADEYSSLIYRVWQMYIITGIILLSITAFLMIYLRKIIHEPIDRIITSLKKGEGPDYKGIYEFEFLSKNIKTILNNLERETRLLNYVYYIAATKRGEDFFHEVVKAINNLFGINSLIARLERDGNSAHVLGLYLNGEVKGGFDLPLKGTPCQDVMEKGQLVVINSGATGLYPDARLLKESGAESYIGFAIFDRTGEPIGILNGFGHAMEFSESDIKVLQTIGQLVASEIERLKEEEDKEHMREQLQQAQKMEAIGTLAGGIAHDFNNMLQGILGYASLLKFKIPPTDPIYKPLDVIEKTAERAAELTRQLLGFARKGKFFVETLNMNDLVFEVIKLITRTFDRAIEIRTDLSGNIWNIEGDKGQIENVILNLCVNARDAMPSGGILSIKTFNKEVKEGELPYSWAIPGRYVVLRVEDTGIGMDPETMKHIFEPFFTTKETGKGTGMGLAMVYGVVKNHNGFITVESEVGKGSVFTIYLPAVEKVLEERKVETECPIRGTGTILVVDDEEPIRALLRDSLTGLGYNIIEAQNGKEAIEIVKTRGGTIDLVILDLIMPVMGGEETLARLKEIAPHIKVIIATGFGVSESLQDVFRNKGVEGFINKPFNITELSRIIKTVRPK